MNESQPDLGNIVRTWTGWIRTKDRDAYRDYVEETGISEYRNTPGNLGAQLMYRDLPDNRTEIVTTSVWDSLDSIRAFAGDDINVAVFYPNDDKYLLDREETVRHYEIAG